MLVLSRKVGEKIVIGGNISVVVTRLAGNRVTLAIDAPESVRIVRGELSPMSEPQPAGKPVRIGVGEAPNSTGPLASVAPVTVSPPTVPISGCSS